MNTECSRYVGERGGRFSVHVWRPPPSWSPKPDALLLLDYIYLYRTPPLFYNNGNNDLRQGRIRVHQSLGASVAERFKHDVLPVMTAMAAAFGPGGSMAMIQRGSSF